MDGSGSSNRLNGDYFLNDDTVTDDGTRDYITGGSGRDFLLVNTDGRRTADVIEDGSRREVVMDIDP